MLKKPSRKNEGLKQMRAMGKKTKMKMEADKHDKNSKMQQHKERRRSKKTSHGEAKRKLKKLKKPTHKEKSNMKTMSRANWNDC